MNTINRPNLEECSREQLQKYILSLEQQLTYLRDKQLGERIKELNCLYSISKHCQTKNLDLEQIIQGTLNLIPMGWQFPNLTCARCTIYNQILTTSPFKESEWSQSQEIIIDDEKVGRLEIYYMEYPLGDVKNQNTEDENSPFLKEEGQLLIGIVETISRALDRFQSEQKIKHTLNEKEVLLKEVNHRVKNNLQVMSSFITLQVDQIKDPKYVQLFKEFQLRIKSMSLLHDILYRNDDLGSFNFSDYLKILVRNIFRSYQLDPNQIKLNLEISRVHINFNKAIYCGLIINELVSNSIKHAFPDKEPGYIEVRASALDENQVMLEVEDSGRGMKIDNTASTSSLGLHIVKLLVEKIKGTLLYENSHGSKTSIIFDSN